MILSSVPDLTMASNAYSSPEHEGRDIHIVLNLGFSHTF
jgi:hypothetical protein